MWRYAEFTVGAVLIALAIKFRIAAMRRVFACWRDADPRGWAATVRQMRRRWPFNAIVASSTYSLLEQKWRWQPPDWFLASRPARRWFRVAGLAGILFLAGMVLIIAAVFG